MKPHDDKMMGWIAHLQTICRTVAWLRVCRSRWRPREVIFDPIASRHRLVPPYVRVGMAPKPFQIPAQALIGRECFPTTNRDGDIPYKFEGVWVCAKFWFTRDRAKAKGKWKSNLKELTNLYNSFEVKLESVYADFWLSNEQQ